jgi:hypothetical protein
MLPLEGPKVKFPLFTTNAIDCAEPLVIDALNVSPADVPL